MRKGEVWSKGTRCLYKEREIEIKRCYRPVTRMLIEFVYTSDPDKTIWFCQEKHFRRNYKELAP